MPRKCPYPFDEKYVQLGELLFKYFTERNVKVTMYEPDDHALVFSNMVPSGADSGNRVAKGKEIVEAWAEIEALAKEIEGLVLDKLGGVFSFKFYFDSEETKNRFFAARECLRKR